MAAFEKKKFEIKLSWSNRGTVPALVWREWRKLWRALFVLSDVAAWTA